LGIRKVPGPTAASEIVGFMAAVTKVPDVGSEAKASTTSVTATNIVALFEDAESPGAVASAAKLTKIS